MLPRFFASFLLPVALAAASASGALAEQSKIRQPATNPDGGKVGGGQMSGAPDVGGQKAFHPVEFDSLDTKGLFSSESLRIKGYVFDVAGGTKGKGPAAVLAPSCGGPVFPGGMIRPNYRAMARQLREIGIVSVLVDGFTPRGQGEICTQKAKQRTIDTDVRIKDSFAALRYLRGRNDVDPTKVFLITWGAAGSMESMNAGSPHVEKIGGGFRAAVMFFPQCDKLAGTFAPYAPIQVFVGEKDEWNPAGPCLSLLQHKSSASAAMDVKVYPDTYHGFDLPGEPKPVSNAVVSNVMVGGNQAARDDAYTRTKAFLSQFVEK